MRLLYRCLDRNGGVQEGILDADSINEGSKQLSGRGWTVLFIDNLTPVQQPERPTIAGLPEQEQAYYPKLNSAERALLLRSVAAMVKAGIGFHEALVFLARSGESLSVRRVTSSLARRVLKGHMLSDSLQQVGGGFREFQISLIRLGERTGSLLPVFERLADHEEEGNRQRAQLRSALTYPAIAVGLCLVFFLLLPPLVLRPQLRLIQELQGEAPALTQALLQLSAWVSSPAFWFLGVLAVVVLTSVVRLWLQRPNSLQRLWSWLLQVPPLGRLLKVAASQRFCAAMSLLLKAGAPLVEGMNLAAAAAGDPILQQRLVGARERLIEGATLTETLEDCDFFPRAMVEGVRVGEESGQLDRQLDWLAGFYQLELEASLAQFRAWIEPLLLMGVGCLVGLLLLATMLPLVQTLRSVV